MYSLTGFPGTINQRGASVKNYTMFGEVNGQGSVGIDVEAKYGFWEARDGAEGGGLWFDDYMQLIDYDGAAYLPKRVVYLLNLIGYIPDSEVESFL